MSYKECFMRRHAAAMRKAKRTGRAEMRPSPTAVKLVHEQKAKPCAHTQSSSGRQYEPGN